MDNIKLLTINDSNIGDCHTINENNVPNVGTTTFKEFEILVQNSDFHRCVILDNKVLGFLICFKDSYKTKSFMYSIKHKNFNEFRNQLKNFMYVDRIAVDEKYRNNGIASTLYEILIDYCLTTDIEYLTAEINLLPVKNEPSFMFHSKYQFKEINTKKYSEDYEVSLQKRIL
ncbi:GNAT family N-acetyltransferase [Acidimicrobiaceae bacterium]|nr:GNAT family N-acetyltransferase [Acidimicrobiaceae bacterium]|tara:strand:+ start:227 stop:742 length:516 start_codon:yes stop_codon:yes gene_type:complete